jgi:hypothetical protein
VLGSDGEASRISTERALDPETAALLKILELGEQQIRAGLTVPAEDVLADLLQDLRTPLT